MVVSSMFKCLCACVCVCWINRIYWSLFYHQTSWMKTLLFLKKQYNNDNIIWFEKFDFFWFQWLQASLFSNRENNVFIFIRLNAQFIIIIIISETNQRITYHHHHHPHIFVTSVCVCACEKRVHISQIHSLIHYKYKWKCI